jgi:hypothetical protein
VAGLFCSQDPDRERAEELYRHGHAESDRGDSKLERDGHQSGHEPQPDEKAKVRPTVRTKIGAHKCQEKDCTANKPKPTGSGWTDDGVELGRHGRRKLEDGHCGHGKNPAWDTL